MGGGGGIQAGEKREEHVAGAEARDQLIPMVLDVRGSEGRRSSEGRGDRRGGS